MIRQGKSGGSNGGTFQKGPASQIQLHDIF
jgi:hypothetical protein